MNLLNINQLSVCDMCIPQNIKMKKTMNKRTKKKRAISILGTLIFSAGILYYWSLKEIDTSLIPTRLRCEYIAEPLGLQVDVPFLSWQFKSELRDQKQTAYQILQLLLQKRAKAAKAVAA